MERGVYAVVTMAVLMCLSQTVHTRPSKSNLVNAKFAEFEKFMPPPMLHKTDTQNLIEKGETMSATKRYARENPNKDVNKISLCRGSFCDPGWEPYPNIVSAMTGYNILKGNAFNFGTEQDPGFDTGYIFVPVVKDDDGRYALHGGITVRAVSKCDLTLSTTSTSTLKEYQNINRKVEGKPVGWNTDPPVEFSSESLGVKAGAKLPPLFESYGMENLDQRRNEEFFSKEHGVLTVSTATCALYSMRISRRYPPPFQIPFKNAIKTLSEAADDKRKTEFHKFIQDFGTHFLQKATLGARLSISRRHRREAYQRTIAENIAECNKIRLVDWYIGDETNDKCTNVTDAKKRMISQIGEREKILSDGSRPGYSLTDWANQEFRYPVPIKLTLAPIIELFHEDFMKHDEELRNIDYAAMKEWMSPLFENYCEDVKSDLGLSHCKAGDVQRCGYNDKCNAAYQDCVQISSTKVTCVTKITQKFMELKLDEAMESIRVGMSAEDVGKLIKNSEIGKLRGFQSYVIVLENGYGLIHAAGENVVLLDKNRFHVAVAWVNSNELGRSTNFSSNVQDALPNPCYISDYADNNSMSKIIKDINLHGHDVKFFVFTFQPARYGTKMAISRPPAAFSHKIECYTNPVDVYIMIGPGV